MPKKPKLRESLTLKPTGTEYGSLPEPSDAIQDDLYLEFLELTNTEFNIGTADPFKLYTAMPEVDELVIVAHCANISVDGSIGWSKEKWPIFRLASLVSCTNAAD